MEKAPDTRLRFAGMEWASETDAWHDFPALALDGQSRIWLAMLSYANGRRFVRVAALFAAEDAPTLDLAVTGATGMGPPAVCGDDQGCIVACSVELDGRWRIACFRVGADISCPPEPLLLDAGGTINCAPAVAAADSGIHVIWQSNAGGRRTICAAAVTSGGPGEITRLSAPDANSQNPAIVTMGEGDLFAAWDSMRGDAADIFGAQFRNGAWGGEQRLTSDARIERHPFLAVRDGEVWMAWGGASYPDRQINRLTEQRIVLARLNGNRHDMIADWFDEISPADQLRVRPAITFDRAGRLWLSSRRSLGPQNGWSPELRVHDGNAWTDAKVPTRHIGRWRPVPLLPLGDRTLYACQCDDLPVTWNEQGIWPDWRSWIEVAALRVDAEEAPRQISLEPLAMPDTTFDLAAKRDLCAAELSEQKAEVAGNEVVLLWGDLHDHTDLSVCDRAKNPPGPDLFANERDIEQLDFCALTDHGYNMDPAQWAYNGEQTRRHHDPDRFVTLLGQEWTSEVAPPAPDGNTNRYGHHNLVFLDPYHPYYYDAHDGDISPSDLWAEIGDADVLCIPHQLACWEGKGAHNVPKQWDHVDERIQPVAEICQTRGSYEGLGCPYQSKGATPWRGHFLQDAWANGIIIGVIASPDHGGGKGKAGVWAEARTREAIFAAIRARHTFGTSGAKMSLLFRCGEAMMGDVLARPAGPPAPFTIDAVCLRPIRSLSILRNNDVVYEESPDQAEVHLRWEDTEAMPNGTCWYYVRMSTGDDEWAWSSPIWFMQGDKT